MGYFRIESINRLQQELPGVEIHQINNTTHMSIGIHQPDALAGFIRKFLKEPMKET